LLGDTKEGGNVNMNTKQLLGLIGSMILFVGVFTPIVSIPFIGNLNYFQKWKRRRNYSIDSCSGFLGFGVN
jgi:hypothetical protein